jgi:transcriptional regulator with XRE-family HTH domain
MSANMNLGTIVKRIRQTRRWTLADMSEACGIPLSTLSKIENNKLTLTYDRLQQLSRSLGIGLAELFSEGEPSDVVVTGRRSIAKLDAAVKIETPNYVYNYLCSDLRKRLMIPIHVKINTKSLAEFGDLVRHGGEEFAYVLEGAVTFHSEFYAPVMLRTGEGIYIDSNMGHGYIVADGFDEATILSICASADENLQEHLMAEAEGRGEPASFAA